jgi:phosphopantothenoylcysteine decarboxylase/phosphopantothenate--cysteine ligase
VPGKVHTVVVGVTGGIACYKAAELVRLLAQEGLAVQVVMTRAATEFVAPLTFQTLSGRPVATDLFSLTEESEIGHIRVAAEADLVILAPATANALGKIAAGIADDLLTTIVLATTAPVLVAPSMNVHMYENPIVQENIGRLEARGFHFMKPGEGYLACGYEGKGRLPEPPDIVAQARSLLKKKDLGGERLLITAGPSREPIDPVRFLSNRSSGKMGYALARAGVRRGAQVTLVSGPTSLPPPVAARVLRVTTAGEMLGVVLREFREATAVLMAAAVSDYRPKEVAPRKIKRKSKTATIELTRNQDILKNLGAKKNGKLLVGFAAETEDLVGNARRKLREKNLDLIVANDVLQAGSGFEGDTNVATLIDREGKVTALPLMSKEELADRIYDRLLELKRRD